MVGLAKHLLGLLETPALDEGAQGEGGLPAWMRQRIPERFMRSLANILQAAFDHTRADGQGFLGRPNATFQARTMLQTPSTSRLMPWKRRAVVCGVV